MEVFPYGNVDTCGSTVCYNFPVSLREEDHSAFNLKDWKYVRSRYFRTQPSANFHCRVAPSNNRPWFLLRISKIYPNPSVFCFLSVRVRTINATEALHSIHNISSQEIRFLELINNWRLGDWMLVMIACVMSLYCINCSCHHPLSRRRRDAVFC